MLATWHFSYRTIDVCVKCQLRADDMQDRANVRVPQNATASMDLQQLESSAAVLQQTLEEMLPHADRPAIPSGERFPHVPPRLSCVSGSKLP